MQDHDAKAGLALRETRAWVLRAVVGLNLCPFAKAPQVRGRVRYVVARADSAEALLAALGDELAHLVAVDEAVTETTLLIHPWVLQDFTDFNDFLELGDALVADTGLEGVVQLASFHPHYRFAGTAPDDIGNATNRSPFPTLHLLRESSVARAVDAFPEADAIFAANIERLERFGPAAWDALRQACRADAMAGVDDATGAPP